jgi:hypothetical protein
MTGNARLQLGLFIIVPLLSWASVTTADDALADRRARLEQMDPQEREQLSQSYARFLRLDPAEQERLRQLHADLEADPERDELRAAMQHYQEWLSELPASQRIMLSALPAEDRLKRIDELRTAQGKRNKLGPQDLKAIDSWIVKHDFQKKWFEAQRDNRTPLVTPEELADLRATLSEAAQKALDDAKSDEDQRRLVRAWVFQARMPGPSGGRSGFHKPSEKETREFLENELTESQRAYLRALPPEQMQRELFHLWREHHGKQGEPARERPDGRPSRRGSSKSEKNEA